MKHLLLAASIACLSSNAYAFAVEITICSGKTATHSYEAKSVSEDVLVTFENNTLANWGEVGRSPKYKLQGKTKTEMLIKTVSLTDFIHSSAASESLVSAMFSRPEYVGEADMVHYYASEMLSRLECK